MAVGEKRTPLGDSQLRTAPHATLGPNPVAGPRQPESQGQGQPPPNLPCPHLLHLGPADCHHGLGHPWTLRLLHLLGVGLARPKQR